MKNLRFLIAALAFVTFFSACKKDDAPKVKTKAEMISNTSGKRWTISSMTAKYTFNGQQQEQDAKPYYFPEECQRDNIMVLYADKKYETREGTVKCSTNDVVATGTWELKNNDTELHITSGGNALFSKILELSETTIKTEFPATYNLNGGGTAQGTTTVVYTAQ
jgi:hypothetical protein